MPAIDLPDVSVLLVAIVFSAALLQAVTGLGFGLIAGPALLVFMDSSAAIQVTIVLSFAIALALSPSTLPRVDWSLLKPLSLGICLGAIAGAVTYSHVSLQNLKWGAAAAVLAMAAISTGFLERHPLFRRDNDVRRLATGALSGALTATLAMPGPPVAAYATALRHGKETIRATTLVTFLFAYPVALAMQAGMSGVSERAAPMCAALLFPALAGTLTGYLLGRAVPESIFRWLITVLLVASAAALAIA